MLVLPKTREGQEIRTRHVLQLLHKEKSNRTREQGSPQIEVEVEQVYPQINFEFEQAPPQGDN